MENLDLITFVSMRAPKSLLAGLLCMTTLAACEPEDELSEADDVHALSEDIEVVEHDVIAELLVDEDTTITFTREEFEGDSEIYMVGIKILGVDGGVAYDKLFAEQGLSPLEIFVAFAPDGVEAPDELLESHEAMALAQERDPNEVRDLILPRSVYVLNSVYCDSYALFTNFIDSVWTNHGISNQRITSKSFYSHSLQKNSWHSAAANACNYDNTVDSKTIYMCARPGNKTSRTWTCDSVSLANGLRATKVWFPVDTGGEYYQVFDYSISAEPTSGWVMSYLGLNVAIWGPL